MVRNKVLTQWSPMITPTRQCDFGDFIFYSPLLAFCKDKKGIFPDKVWAVF